MVQLQVTDQGSGPAILWIHGFPLASEIFRDQLTIAGARHLVPDLPGFGRSRDVAPPETIEGFARVALEVLDARGIDRAVFAGVSMGGYICLAAAAIAPERLTGLILIDTRETADTEQARRGRIETIDKVQATGSTGFVVDAMLPKMVTPTAPLELRERVREIMESATPAGVIAASRAMAARPDSASLLPRLDVPALVVVGETDPITTPEDAKRMAAALPDATLVVLSDAAHLSNMEQTEKFNAAVAEFLTRTR